jgi:hypothetical protein
MNPEELWNQLQNAVTMRSSQDQVIWSIFGIFWAANAVLLVAVFASNAWYVVFVVSAIGIFTSAVWLMLLHRAVSHISIDEDLMRDIENVLFENYPQFRITLAPNTQSRITGTQARVTMRWSVGVFFAIWSLGFGVGLVLLLIRWGVLLPIRWG